MKIKNLDKPNLITEGWNDPALTLMEEKIIIPFVKELEQYVIEANLSQDQIKNLFTGIEQGATAAGGNRTAVGKAADVAKLPVEAVKWIDTQINKLGSLVQNAGPVKNADAKFEELKKKIGEKDSKVVSAVKAVSDWAKKNPGKASIAVGILTAAAAVAGGPLGGAVAGFLARATKDLLQGEKLSTAVGKSIKTAAYGAIAGWALNGIGDWLEGLRVDAIPYDKAPGLTTLKVGFTDTFEVPGFKSVRDLGSMVIPEDQVGEFTKLLDVMKDATAASGSTDSSTALDAFNKLWNFAKTFDKAEFIADMNLSNEISKAIAVSNDQFLSNLEMANSAIAAAAQASIQTSDDKKSEFKVGGKEVSSDAQPQMSSRVYTGQKLSEGQIYLLFNRLSSVNQHMLENKLMFESVFDAVSHYNRTTLNEGPLDFIKKAGKAVGGALKKGAKAVGGAIKGATKQLTTKVTAEKLNRAWKDAGSPTDSDEIYNVIKSLGVNDDVIKGTYDSMQIKPPATTDAPDADADADAADNSTNANAPTDSTAGDAGSDTTATGAADANAGGDEPAAGDTASTSTDAGSSDTTASTNATSSDATSNDQSATSNKSSDQSATSNKSSDQSATSNKSSDQTSTSTTSTSTSSNQGGGGAGGGGAGGGSSTDTTSSSSSSQTDTSTNKQGSATGSSNAGSSDSNSNDMQKAANTKGAPDDFKQAAQAAAGGTTGVDLKALAGQIKKAGPEVVDSVKKVLATA